MNALTETKQFAIQTLAPDDAIDVLCSSIYPGAKRESAKLALAYCKATGLDPMQKPVHLVPMKVKTGRKTKNGYDETEERDVVMPGIGLYRIQAARTGQHISTSEPEYGPTKTLQFKRKEWYDDGNGRSSKMVDDEIEYPEWCRVVVERWNPLTNLVGKFIGMEFWLENYATAGRDNDAPNEMWRRRSRAQLAKCAEAQALRKGFPEVGAQPTADEMIGKHHLDDDLPQGGETIDQATGEITNLTPLRKGQAAIPAPARNAPAEGVTDVAPTDSPKPPAATGTGPDDSPANDAQKVNVVNKCKALGEDVDQVMAMHGATLVTLTLAQFRAVRDYLMHRDGS